MKKELKKEFKEEILNEQIVIGKYFKSINPTKEEYEEMIRKELMSRMEALYKEYDLPYKPKEYGHKLAYILAMEYIFKPKMTHKKKGRPQKWKGFGGIALFLRVSIKSLEKEGRSLREAIHLVMKDINIPDENLNSVYVRYNEVINNESPENKAVIGAIEAWLSEVPYKKHKIEYLKQMLAYVEKKTSKE